jgi:hypothetical protein
MRPQAGLEVVQRHFLSLGRGRDAPPACSRVYLTEMSALCNEDQLRSIVPLTHRQLLKLRREGKIPFVRIDRYNRLYDPEQVVAALGKLEVRTNGTTENVAETLETKVKGRRATAVK